MIQQLQETKRIYGQTLAKHFDKYDALQDADVLVICTEWQQFRF